MCRAVFSETGTGVLGCGTRRAPSGVGMPELALQAGLSNFYCNPACFSHTLWWGFFHIGFSGTGLIKVDVR
jgi:hypothetical protein